MSRAFLTALVLTLTARIAMAQGEAAEPVAPPSAPSAPAVAPAAADPATPSAPETPDVSAVVRGTPPETFEEQWQQRRRAQSQFDRAATDALLAAMVEAKQTAGWPNLVTYGLAVARESNTVGRTGETGRALRLAEAATKLAPARPETWGARAKAHFDSGEPVAAVSDLGRAAVAVVSDPIELRLRAGNLALAAIVALLVGAFVFAVTAIYRHQGELIFSVLKVLPAGATRFQAALLISAVVATPLLLALGPVWTALIWIALPMAYYDRIERIGSCIVICFLALLPLVLPLATHYLGYPGSRAQDVYLAATDMGARDAAARVAAQPKPTATELLALGMRESYAGHIEQATRLIEKSIGQGMTHPSAYTTLGNLRFAVGDRAGAITAYEAALARNSKHVPALFNISRVYFSLTEHQKAGEAHRAATTVNYDLVELFDREAKQRGPAYMAPDDVPRSVFAAMNPSAPQVAAAAHDVWRELSGRTIAEWYMATALGFGVLITIAGFFKKTTTTTKPGAKPVIAPTSSVDPLQRIRHEIETHRHSVRLLRMRRVLSVFLAGAGQLLVGRSLSGLAFLVVFLTSGIMLLIALDVVPSPVPLAGGPSLLALLVYLGTAGVAYIISLVDSQREDV